MDLGESTSDSTKDSVVDDKDNSTNTHVTPKLIESEWTNARGRKLWTRRWIFNDEDISKAKGLVFFVHGMHAHGSPTTRPGLGLVINSLMKTGEIIVCNHDHAGHGKSEGIRGLIESFDQIFHDAIDYIEKVRTELGKEKPFVILAESMGGALSVLLGLHFQDNKDESFKGLALIAPAILFDKPPELVLTILRGIAKIGPSWALGPDLEVDKLWRTKEDIEMALKDNLRHIGRVRLQTGQLMIDMQEMIFKRQKDINYSFATFHGTDDKTIPIDASKQLYECSSTPTTRKQLVIYESACHDLMHDPITNQFIQDVTKWIHSALFVNEIAI